jgi:hypothetical protein
MQPGYGDEITPCQTFPILSRSTLHFTRVVKISARRVCARFVAMAGLSKPSKVHTRHDSANGVSLQFGVRVAIAMQALPTDGDD